MFEAVDGMNDERAFIFTCFGPRAHATCTRPHAQQSVSHHHTPTNGAHGPYTHSDLLYERAKESQHLVVYSGRARTSG